MNNFKLKITTAKFTDFSDLFKLWKKAGLGLAELAEEKKEFKQIISLNPCTCFVAKIDQQIVGGVLGLNNGRRAWIYHLAVDPKWQKHGIGKKLLHSVEQVLHQSGASKIRLWVDFKNLKVAPFYEKFGYSVMSDALMLGKNLEECPPSFKFASRSTSSQSNVHFGGLKNL